MNELRPGLNTSTALEAEPGSTVAVSLFGKDRLNASPLIGRTTILFSGCGQVSCTGPQLVWDLDW